MSIKRGIQDEVIGVVSGVEVTPPALRMVGQLDKGVRCTRCGCTVWTWFTTTSIELETDAGRATPTNIISREMRCGRCGKKAAAEIVNRIKETLAFRAARREVVRSEDETGIPEVR